MKKTGLFLILLISLVLTGCGDKNEVTLGQYKGLTYTPISTEVNADEIQAALNVVINQSTTYEEDVERRDTEVKKADMITLDFTGTLKDTGAEFKGGSEKDLKLTIGSGKCIPGFEDALIGKKVGETCEITLVVPKDYSTDSNAAGKEATFTVTIKNVLKANVPEMTDELIKKYTEGAHTTVDSYKSYCTEYLKAQKEADAKEVITAELLDKALKNTTFSKLDQKQLDEYYNQVYHYYEQIAEHYNITVESYAEYYFDQSLDEFKKAITRISEETMREQLMLDLIIEKENITLSDTEYAEKVPEYMVEYGYSNQAEFEAAYTVEKLKESMLYDKAIEFIYTNAKPAEK